MRSLLMRSAEWIGASIGLSGILVAFGWLIVVGQRSMLGVQFAIPETSQLIGLAAEYLLGALLFALDRCIGLLDWIIEHVGYVLLFVVALLCVLAVWYTARSHRWFARWGGYIQKFVVGLKAARNKLPFIIVGLVVIIATREVFVYHVPALTINHVLTRDLTLPNPFEPHAALKDASLRLWTQVKCAHIAGRSHGVCTMQSAEYFEAIKARHLLSLVLTLVLGACLWRVLRKSSGTPERAADAAGADGWLVNTAIVVVAINVLMLPITYGAVVRPPEFPETTVYLAVSDKNKTPLLPNMERDEDAIYGYLLSEDGKILTIFAKGHVYPIIEIPMSQIRAISIRPNNDVLTARLYQLFKLNDPN